MAKITFDAQDGSPVQEFDVTLPVAAPAAPAVTDTEVKVEKSDGTEEVFPAATV